MTNVYPIFVLGALFVAYRAPNPEAVNKYSSNSIVLMKTICDKSSSHGPNNGRSPTDPDR